MFLLQLPIWFENTSKVIFEYGKKLYFDARFGFGSAVSWKYGKKFQECGFSIC